MSTGLRLIEYATTPLYNIKAVVQATGISPSTLRAWERRYNIARPQRSDSGYRLYSERDIAIIRWLKTQVDAGMSISQAVSWLGNITTEAGETEQAVLPVAGSGAPLHDPANTLPTTHREEVRDFNTLRHQLILALLHFDEDTAEIAIAEAFSLYPVEQVGDQLFMRTLTELGERRQRGDLSFTVQNFAHNYLIHRLGTLLRAIPNHATGVLIWVGSANTAVHEASALLLSIYLRRTGYHVHYLGQNLPTEEEAVADLVKEARRHQPAMILFSTSAAHTIDKLGPISPRPPQINRQPIIIGYSGPIYARNPELRAANAGVYIGTSAREVIQNIDELLAEKHRGEKRYDIKQASTNHDAPISDESRLDAAGNHQTIPSETNLSETNLSETSQQAPTLGIDKSLIART